MTPAAVVGGGARGKHGSGGAGKAEEEVVVSKWKHGGEVGKCSAHLIDRQPWMAIKGGETEGSLACPSCGSKVGQFSLGGLKCTCGLHVCPAFKLPRAKVDEIVGGSGEGALEAALHAAELAERDVEEGEGGEAAGGGGAGGRDRRGKRMAVPVSKHKGNFSREWPAGRLGPFWNGGGGGLFSSAHATITLTTNTRTHASHPRIFWT